MGGERGKSYSGISLFLILWHSPLLAGYLQGDTVRASLLSTAQLCQGLRFLLLARVSLAWPKCNTVNRNLAQHKCSCPFMALCNMDPTPLANVGLADRSQFVKELETREKDCSNFINLGTASKGKFGKSICHSPVKIVCCQNKKYVAREIVHWDRHLPSTCSTQVWSLYHLCSSEHQQE